MQVTVPHHRLEAGLPLVCVVTGEEADGLVGCRFSTVPSWTWVLLLCGVLPFLVTSVFTRRVVDAQVPVRREVVDRFHRRRRSSRRLLAAGVVVVGTGLALPVGWLAWAGLVPLLAGVAARVAAALGFVAVRPGRTPTTLRLVRVHPRFVAAVRRDALVAA